MGVGEYVVVKRGCFINLSPLRGWRIGPTSVVRDRQIPNGSRSGDLDLQAWRANDGEGQALALREGAAFFYRSAGACPPRGLGRGTMARGTCSHARVACEGPRPTVKDRVGETSWSR